MRAWRILGWLALMSALSGCVHNNNLSPHWLDRYATQNPTLMNFTVCHGFNCVEKKAVSISAEQWKRVAAVFKPPAKSAQQERQQIGRAVALVESYVGPQAGIAARQWTHKHMLVWPNLGDLTQIDCIDAAVNTWTYMTLMEQAGLFRFHKVAQLSYAGSFTDPDVRNTAVLQEKDGGYFAVDASLVDHEKPPLIMPLAVWLDTWPPDKTKIEHVAVADMPEAAPPARGRTR
jgi:hypothetical protein